jgi:hypothetical protein
MRTSRESVIVSVLALLATAVFFFEYLAPWRRVFLFSDTEIYHYPLQRYALDSLREGRVPQWDPSMYCGIPFAANIQAALFYPPAWLLYAANWWRPVFSFRSLEAYTFAHVWLAFVLCYFWLRRRRLDSMASALGAGVFAYGGYFLWQIVHLGVVTALAWMPLALRGIDESAERRNWRPLWMTALASAMWLLSGYPPSWAAFCFTVVVYALASPGRWRAAAGAVAAIAASMAVSLVQVLPALEAQSGMFGQLRYVGESHNLLIPFFVANWRDFNMTTALGYLDCVYVYWGLAASFALLWAVRRRLLRPCVQPLVVMAACLVLVFDPGSLIVRAVSAAPILARLLQSYNFLEGVAAMAALLTAIGISDFLRARAARRIPQWASWAVMCAMGAWSARQTWIWQRGGVFPSGGAAAAGTLIAFLLFAAALLAFRSETGRLRVLLAVALLMFVFCDYKVYGANRIFNARGGNPDELLSGGGLYGLGDAALREMRANRHFRVTSDGIPSAMAFRMYRLSSPQGLDPLLPARYRDRIARWGVTFKTTRVFLMDYRNPEMLQELGVRYVIANEDTAEDRFLRSNADFRRIDGGEGFFRVYDYLRARPAYDWDGVEGEATPVEWRPERRVFRVRSAAGGRFGLREQFLPGWTARVDGASTPNERWREVFQSVAVPPGEHAVVFEYHSRLLPLGAILSGVATLGLLGVALLDRAAAARSKQPSFTQAA